MNSSGCYPQFLMAVGDTTANPAKKSIADLFAKPLLPRSSSISDLTNPRNSTDVMVVVMVALHKLLTNLPKIARITPIIVG